jgi:hypothetical protein
MSGPEIYTRNYMPKLNVVFNLTTTYHKHSDFLPFNYANDEIKWQHGNLIQILTIQKTYLHRRLHDLFVENATAYNSYFKWKK